MLAHGPCEPQHHESLGTSDGDLRVFRCSWGWCVKREGVPYRARTLVEALEQASGHRLDKQLLHDVIGAIERALEAQHAREQRTVALDVHLRALTATA